MVLGKHHAKILLLLVNKSLCFHITKNAMMEVTEKARNRSGGLLKAKMKKKVTKKNSQFFVA